jgi:hypothetical protein
MQKARHKDKNFHIINLQEGPKHQGRENFGENKK